MEIKTFDAITFSQLRTQTGYGIIGDGTNERISIFRIPCLTDIAPCGYFSGFVGLE